MGYKARYICRNGESDERDIKEKDHTQRKSERDWGKKEEEKK